jgi:hypothetical protein
MVILLVPHGSTFHGGEDSHFISGFCPNKLVQAAALLCGALVDFQPQYRQY